MERKGKLQILSKMKWGSFKYAMAGFISAVKSEVHLRFHLTAAVLTIVAGALIGLSAMEWIAVVMCISLVIFSELMNTAIEVFCDHVTKEINPAIKTVKDVAAAAVLVLSAGSVVVALIIFLPRIIEKI